MTSDKRHRVADEQKKKRRRKRRHQIDVFQMCDITIADKCLRKDSFTYILNNKRLKDIF